MLLLCQENRNKWRTFLYDYYYENAFIGCVTNGMHPKQNGYSDIRQINLWFTMRLDENDSKRFSSLTALYRDAFLFTEKSFEGFLVHM